MYYLQLDKLRKHRLAKTLSGGGGGPQTSATTQVVSSSGVPSVVTSLPSVVTSFTPHPTTYQVMQQQHQYLSCVPTINVTTSTSGHISPINHADGGSSMEAQLLNIPPPHHLLANVTNHNNQDTGSDDSDTEEPSPEALARYMSIGRRHTVGANNRSGGGGEPAMMPQHSTSKDEFGLNPTPLQTTHKYPSPNPLLHHYNMPSLQQDQVLTYKEQSLPKPHHLSIAYDPMSRRASDGGANIELFLQQLNRKKLEKARGQSHLWNNHPPTTFQPTPQTVEEEQVMKSDGSDEEPNQEEVQRYLATRGKRHTAPCVEDTIKLPSSSKSCIHKPSRMFIRGGRPTSTGMSVDGDIASNLQPYQSSDRYRRRASEGATSLQGLQQFSSQFQLSTHLNTVQQEHQQLTQQFLKNSTTASNSSVLQQRKQQLHQHYIPSGTSPRASPPPTSTPSGDSHHQALLHHLQKLHLQQGGHSSPPPSTSVPTSRSNQTRCNNIQSNNDGVLPLETDVEPILNALCSPVAHQFSEVDSLQHQLLMEPSRNHNNNSSNCDDPQEPQQPHQQVVRPPRRTTPMTPMRYKYIPNHTYLPCVEEANEKRHYLSEPPVRLPHPTTQYPPTGCGEYPQVLPISHQGDFPSTIPSFHPHQDSLTTSPQQHHTTQENNMEL